MTVTVEVINEKIFNLLDALEGLGLIHVRPAVPQEAEMAVQENPPSYRWMRGIHAGLHKGSVDDKSSFAERYYGIHAGLHKGSVENFLADCRADKERELAADRCREEERARRRANAAVPS